MDIWGRFFLHCKKFLVDTFNGVKNLSNNFKQFCVDTFNDVKNLCNSFKQFLVDNFNGVKNLSNSFKKFCVNTFYGVKNLCNSFKQFLVDNFNGVKNLSNNFKQFCVDTFYGVKNLCKRSKQFLIDTFNKAKDFYSFAVDTIPGLWVNKNYRNSVFISLGTVAASGITFLFGLGTVSLASMLLPKLVTKTVLGVCVAVPAMGVLGGVYTSERLHSGERPVRGAGHKLKRIFVASLVSLGTLAVSTTTLVLGLGAFSAVKVLFPALTTMTALTTLAAVPVAGVISGVGITSYLDINTDNSEPADALEIRNNRNAYNYQPSNLENRLGREIPSTRLQPNVVLDISDKSFTHSDNESISSSDIDTIPCIYRSGRSSSIDSTRSRRSSIFSVASY